MKGFSKLMIALVGVCAGVTIMLGVMLYMEPQQNVERTLSAVEPDGSENSARISSGAQASDERAAFAMKMRGVCGKDVQLLCSGVEPGKGRVFQCLTRMEANLSEACGAFVRERQSQKVQNSTLTIRGRPTLTNVQDNQHDKHPHQANAEQFVGHCGEDLQKFCKEAAPGGGQKVRCLIAHQTEVSAVCKFYLEDMPAWKSAEAGVTNTGAKIKNACGQEITKFCAEVTPGGGRVVHCLTERKGELSAACKTVLETLPAQGGSSSAQTGKSGHADQDGAKGKTGNVAAGGNESGAKIRLTCGQEIEKFCPSVAPGEGRVVSCLRAREAEISANCKSVITEAAAIRQQ